VTLRLIANNLCLHMCPYSIMHGTVQGHFSCSDSCSRGDIDYCLMKCLSTKIEDMSNLISSDWIRPEDLCYYEKLCEETDNFNLSIKLVERTKSTKFLTRVVEAYARRQYKGNLLDILLWPKSDDMVVKTEPTAEEMKTMAELYNISQMFNYTIVMQSMELGSGLDNIKKIMDMDEMKSGSKTLKKDGCYGIDFEDVTFNYTSGGKDALTSVNLHLEPGTVNAFVGPSGAGKTTAVQLLGRYWDTTGGTIKVGGVPITDLKTENLMDLTAFVFQDVFLLEDTLLENIRMGTNASEEEVRQAARSAQIDDFIMGLPKGYQTRIGDEGVKLSGGQQQRISIARAILKDAPIVIFDEATSYSDIENEHKIQLALQNLLKGKTTIMIAHRLHTIRDADKIVVFQDGTVAEQGTHQELVKKGGVYGRMWEIYTQATIGKEAV